ncbi:MAG: hypothetical protein WC223_09215 [Bacteroidales bacterium]|jgi:hypothetical protein
MTNIKKYFEYKYKIKEKIEKFSYLDYLLAKHVLPKTLGINKRTFEKYMYTKLNESYEIPVGQIARLSVFFQCSMEELLNYKPEPLTIRDMERIEKSNVAAKLGLTK